MWFHISTCIDSGSVQSNPPLGLERRANRTGGTRRPGWGVAGVPWPSACIARLNRRGTRTSTCLLPARHQSDQILRSPGLVCRVSPSRQTWMLPSTDPKGHQGTPELQGGRLGACKGSHQAGMWSRRSTSTGSTGARRPRHLRYDRLQPGRRGPSTFATEQIRSFSHVGTEGTELLPTPSQVRRRLLECRQMDRCPRRPSISPSQESG